MFKSYKIEKHSPRYKKDDSFGRMCKNCGYPNGQHHGWGDDEKCPNGNRYAFPSYPPIFYSEKLNSNIKVL